MVGAHPGLTDRSPGPVRGGASACWRPRDTLRLTTSGIVARCGYGGRRPHQRPLPPRPWCPSDAARPKGPLHVESCRSGAAVRGASRSARSSASRLRAVRPARLPQPRADRGLRVLADRRERLPEPDELGFHLARAVVHRADQLQLHAGLALVPQGAVGLGGVGRGGGRGQPGARNAAGGSVLPEVPWHLRGHRHRLHPACGLRGGHRRGVAVHLRSQLRAGPSVLRAVRRGVAQLDHRCGLGAARPADRVDLEGRGIRGHRLPRRDPGTALRRARGGTAGRGQLGAGVPQGGAAAPVADDVLPGHHPDLGGVPGVRHHRDHDQWRSRLGDHHAQLVHLRAGVPALERGLLRGGRHRHVRGADAHHRAAVPVRGEEGALLMASPLATRPPAVEDTASPPGEPRRRPATLRRNWWGILLLLAVGLVFLIPLYMLLTTAFKTNAEIYTWPMKWLPSKLTSDNITEAWEIAPFGAFIKNSLIVTVVGAALKVLLSIFAAYAFAYLPFPAKKWLFVVMLGALMVPGHVTLLVNYITIGNLGLINTYAGLILPGVASAFGTFLLRQHFMSLPSEVFEAAEVDGAGHLRKLVSFVLPMSVPAVATVALVAVIDEWNNFVWPLIITNSVNMRTLPIGLMYLKSNEGLTNWGVLMSGTLIVVLPMLLVFLFAQRYIVTGLAGAAARSGR